MGKSIFWTEKRKKKAFDLIINEMCEGKSLASIIRDHDRQTVPAFSVFLEWCADDVLLANKYTHAIKVRADLYFEQINDIAQTQIMGQIVTETKEGRKVVKREVKTVDNVARSKLIVDNLQWTVARMAPKKYGNKMEHNGGETPITVNIAVSKEEARQISKDLENDI